MKKLLFLVLLYSCNKITPVVNNKPDLVVQTIVNDTIPSPLLVSGYVSDTTNVVERGVLYGLSENLDVNATDVSYWAGIGLGGYYCPSYENGKVTSSGQTFPTKIQHILSGVTYYVRAYVKLNDGSVVYGNYQQITPRTYNRLVGNYDGANVFWQTDMTLFDISTDEIIYPISTNRYEIYYASNEEPYVHYGVFSTSELTFLCYYKFKNLESCTEWCSQPH